MGTQDSESMDEAPSSLGRRAAIKRGVVASAAAGLVWSAPKIEGLAIRPAYAAAQSAADPTFSVLLRAVSGFPPYAYTENVTSANAIGGLPSKVSSGAVTISGANLNATVFLFFNAPATAVINEIQPTSVWTLGAMTDDIGPGTTLHQRKYLFTTNDPNTAPTFVISCS